MQIRVMAGPRLWPLGGEAAGVVALWAQPFAARYPEKEENRMPVVRKGEGADSLPKGSAITGWGLARFKAGEECDYHYHDCDEFWFLLEGRMAVIENEKEYLLEPGDTLYTPMGLEHGLRALTDTAHFWCALPLEGQRRPGHLHREPKGAGDEKDK